MAITIGRAVLPDPSSVSGDGAVVTFSGTFYSTAATAANRAAEAQVREMQLLGMPGNPDEDVFPVVWSSESRYTAFYTCEDASWDWINDGSGRLSVARWSATMRRLVDGSNALTELQTLALVRTNGHSITQPLAQQAWVPATFLATYPDYYWLMVGTRGSTATFRNSADDAMEIVIEPETLSGTSLYNQTYLVAPGWFHKGACRIEYQAPDGVWYPLVGRMLPSGSVDKWRLSNGYFRVSSTSSGTLTAEVSNGTGWEAYEFGMVRFVSGSYSNLSTFISGRPPAILCNSPDQVTITDTRQTLTITRGNHHVVLTSIGASNPGLRHVTTTASTALFNNSVGIRSTSNDANGNRLVLMAAAATTRDLTEGRLYVTASGTTISTFGIGIELDGSSAATNNSSTALIGQFIGAVSTTTRVVKQ